MRPETTALCAIVTAILAACATQSAKLIPAKPGQVFPNSESFYPLEALRAAQEGIATVHFCVDTDGELTEPPSIAQSSGNAALDAAAVQLATAANGDYIPASRNGVRVKGCSAFRVRFMLRVDPRWPTLSRKLCVLNKEYHIRFDVLRSETAALRLDLVPPPDLAHFVPGDVKQQASLKQASTTVSAILDRSRELIADYIDKLERLSTSGDIPENERTAWAETWSVRRDGFRRNFGDFDSSAREIVNAVNELTSYLETTQPPLHGPTGPVNPTAQQRSEIDVLINRAREAYARMSAAERSATLSASELTFPKPTVRNHSVSSPQ